MQLVRRIFLILICATPAVAQTTFSCPANQYVSTQQINTGQGCSALPTTVQTATQYAIPRYTTAGTGATVGASSVQTDATGMMLGVNAVPTHALDLANNSSATAVTATNTAEAEVINTSGAVNTYEGLGLESNNAAAATVMMAKIAAVNAAVAAGLESGDLHLLTRNAGTLTDWWQIAHDGGFFSTGVAGGDKGAGTINATALYVGGVAVGGGGSATSLQANGTGLATSTTVNFRTGTGNGGVVVTNPGAGNVDYNLSLPIAGVQAAFATMPNAGLTVGALCTAATTTGGVACNGALQTNIPTLSGVNAFGSRNTFSLVQLGAVTTIASASTVAPTTPIVIFSGTTTIDTITPPNGTAALTGAAFDLTAPSGLTISAAGNVAASLAVTANAVFRCTYFGTTDSKWRCK